MNTRLLQDCAGAKTSESSEVYQIRKTWVVMIDGLAMKQLKLFGSRKFLKMIVIENLAIWINGQSIELVFGLVGCLRTSQRRPSQTA